MTPGGIDGSHSRDASFFVAMLLVLAALTAYRVAIAVSHGLPLNVDEAQYWLWAQSLDWGYFSKPPMIAAVIWLPTQICGDSEPCVRAAPLIAYPITALLIYATTRRLYGSRAALFAGVAFATMPGVSFSSFIISTDVPLFLFWALALFAFVRAVDANLWRDWLLLGVAGGFGLLTKYTMGIFAASAILCLLLVRERRHLLQTPGPYLSAALAGLIFLPNVIWNILNDYPTIRHTAHISNLGSVALHWSELGEFLAGQLIVFGPVLVVIFLWALLPPSTLTRDGRVLLLCCFSLPFLAIISMQALFGRANANWAAPTYVAATVIVAGYLMGDKRRGKSVAAALALAVNLFLGAALGAAVHDYQRLLDAFDVEFSARTDPFKRYRHWDRFAAEIAPVLKEFPEAILMGDERDVLSQLVYHIEPHPIDAVVWNPSGTLRTHFHLTTTLEDKLGKDFIFVTDRESIESIRRAFEETRLIDEVAVEVHRDWHIRARIFYLKNFRGYEHLD